MQHVYTQYISYTDNTSRSHSLCRFLYLIHAQCESLSMFANSAQHIGRNIWCKISDFSWMISKKSLLLPMCCLLFFLHMTYQCLRSFNIFFFFYYFNSLLYFLFMLISFLPKTLVLPLTFTITKHRTLRCLLWHYYIHVSSQQ